MATHGDPVLSVPESRNFEIDRVARRRPTQTSPAASVEVTTSDGRRAVFAAVPIRAGETVLAFHGMEAPQPTRHSIQIGKDRHLVAPQESAPSGVTDRPTWESLNHSCVPNAYVRGGVLVALQHIPAGVEVTFDYNTTEWDLAEPFDCVCGHASCVGIVRGHRWLDDAERRSRLDITAPYLLDAEEHPEEGTRVP